MRERRRTILAMVALILAVAAVRQPIAVIEVAPHAVDAGVPTAQAAVDLGALGTIGINWTLKRFF